MIKSYKDLILKTTKNKDETKDTKGYQKYLRDNDDVSTDIRWIAREYFAYKESFILPSKIKGIKNYIMYKWDRWVALKKLKKESWKSNGKSPITKILTDIVYSKLFSLDFQAFTRQIKDPNKFENIIDSAQDKEDGIYDTFFDNQHISVDENQAFLDFCWSSSDARYNLAQVIFDLCSIWEWYAYIDMAVSDEYIDVSKNIGKKMSELSSLSKEDKERAKTDVLKEAVPVLKSNAVFKYIPAVNIIYEFDKDFERSSFVWVFEYEDMDSYLQSHPYIKMSDTSIYYCLNNKSKISGKDYNQVKLLSSYESYIWDRCKPTSASKLWDTISIVEDEIISLATEVNKKKCEWYSHYTKDTITVFCNGNLVFDWPNQVITGILPIVRFTKSIIGWATTSQGTTETLLDIQTSADLIFNSADDALKASLNPIFYTNGYANIQWVDDYLPIWDWYKIYKWDLNSIQKLETIRFDYNVLKMYDNYRQQWVMSVWLNQNVTFWEWGQQQTSNNFNKLYALSTEVLKPAIFSIWVWLTKAFKIWSILAHTRLPQTIKIKTTGDDVTTLDAVVRLENIISDTEIVYQPLSMNDMQDQNIINNLTLFSNMIAAHKQDWTTWVINYNNAALIKQFGKKIWLKNFFQSDQEYWDKKKQAIENEYELEKLKITKQNEIQALLPKQETPDKYSQDTWQGEVNKIQQRYVDTDLLQSIKLNKVDIAE